jgi:hypothetical protein
MIESNQLLIPDPKIFHVPSGSFHSTILVFMRLLTRPIDCSILDSMAPLVQWIKPVAACHHPMPHAFQMLWLPNLLLSAGKNG